MVKLEPLWGIDDEAVRRSVNRTILLRCMKTSWFNWMLLSVILGGGLLGALVNILLRGWLGRWGVPLGSALSVLFAFELGHRVTAKYSRMVRADVLRSMDRCVECGYQLAGPSSNCPECGRSPTGAARFPGVGN